MTPPMAPRAPEVVGSGSGEAPKGYPSLVDRIGKQVDNAGGVTGIVTWYLPLLGGMIGVPAFLLYQLLKSKKKPKGINWPLVASIGLPAGYFFGSAYLRRKADQAREEEYKRKRREEAAQAP